MTHHAPIQFDDSMPTKTPDLREEVIQRIIRRSDVVAGVWRRDRLYRLERYGDAEIPRL